MNKETIDKIIGEIKTLAKQETIKTFILDKSNIIYQLYDEREEVLAIGFIDIISDLLKEDNIAFSLDIDTAQKDKVLLTITNK